MITYRYYREKNKTHPIIRPNTERSLLMNQPDMSQLIMPDDMFHNHIINVHNQGWQYVAIEYECKYHIDHLMNYVKDINNPLELSDLVMLPINISCVTLKKGLDKITMYQTKVEVTHPDLINTTLSIVTNDTLPYGLY